MDIRWYGAWVLIYAVTSYASILGTLMLSNAIVRFFPEEKDFKKTFALLLSLVISISLIITLLVLLMSDWLSKTFLKDEVFSRLIFWGGFLILADSVKQMMENYLRAHDDVRMFSVVQGIYPLLEIALMSLTLTITRDLVFSLQVFLAVVFTIEIFFIARILRGTRLKDIFAGETLKVLSKYLNYSLPLVPGGLTALVSSNGDRFIIGYLLDGKAVGVYSIAYALASSVMLFNAPITNSLFPKVSKLHADRNFKTLSSYIAKGVLLFVGIGLALLLLVAVFGNEVLQLLSGGSTSVVEHDGLYIALIVLCALLVYGIGRIVSIHLFLMNKTKTIFLVYLGGALVNVLLNFAFIQYWGLIGAGVSTLASYILISLSMLYAIRRTKEMYPLGT